MQRHQENLTTEASHCSLMDLWFLVFEWIKDIIYYLIFITNPLHSCLVPLSKEIYDSCAYCRGFY